MAWVTQLLQDDLISRPLIPSAKTLFPNEVPRDTAFGKVTIPLCSMELDLIPIWRPGAGCPLCQSPQKSQWTLLTPFLQQGETLLFVSHCLRKCTPELRTHLPSIRGQSL
jgi:hypothetical protein